MFWGHITYPAIVILAAKNRRSRGVGETPLSDVSVSQAEFQSLPPYTVVIPAYLEAGEITAAVARWRANGAQDVLVAVDADPETEQAARDAGATISRSDVRGGKVLALNRAVPEVQTPIALLTDANTVIEREHALRLVSHVASGRADVAGGVKVEDLAESESRYWKFENTLKQSEEELGGCPILVGEAVVLRPSQWESLPGWIQVDDLYLSARYSQRGMRVRVDTSCLASEPSAPPAEQHTRRVRMAAGVIGLVLGAPGTLLGADIPRLMILGHKVFRLTVGPPAQFVLAAATAKMMPAWLGVPAAAAQLFPIGDYAAHVRSEKGMTGVRGLFAQAVGMAPVVWVDSVRQLTRQRGSLSGTWHKVAR